MSHFWPFSRSQTVSSSSMHRTAHATVLYCSHDLNSVTDTLCWRTAILHQNFIHCHDASAKYTRTPISQRPQLTSLDTITTDSQRGILSTRLTGTFAYIIYYSHGS